MMGSGGSGFPMVPAAVGLVLLAVAIAPPLLGLLALIAAAIVAVREGWVG